MRRQRQVFAILRLDEFQGINGPIRIALQLASESPLASVVELGGAQYVLIRL